MSDLFSASNLVVSSTHNGDIGFQPRYSLTHPEGDVLLGTVVEPKPRVLQKIAPITSPILFRFRVEVRDAAENPLFTIDKRYRFRRVEARVEYPNGALIGFLKTSPLDPSKRCFRLVGAQRNPVGEIRRSSQSDYVVHTTAGTEAAWVSGRHRGIDYYLGSLPRTYTIVFTEETVQPLRTLTIAFPIVLDLSRTMPERPRV